MTEIERIIKENISYTCSNPPKYLEPSHIGFQIMGVSACAKALEQYVIKARIEAQIDILQEIADGTDWRTTDKIAQLKKGLN